MPLADPVIVVPGITATYLVDEYPLPPEIVWAALTKDFLRASLHPDNVRYELIEPARVARGQLVEDAYKELIAELRHNLTPRADMPVPVYPFGYDWRRPLADIEQQLADFIDEVIERTRLMRHFVADGYGPQRPARVSLIGHSMGGLIIAGYLERKGKKSKVGKVVTLASPFRGSLEAVLKIATGLAYLGGEDSASREREAARLTPALYHLLPSFEDCLEPAGYSLFDPAAWQPAVIETLAGFVRLHAVHPPVDDAAALEQASALFRALLSQAADHRKRLEDFRLAHAGLTTKDWLCVVGMHSSTRLRLPLAFDEQGKPRFVVDRTTRLDLWGQAERPRAEWAQSGDGTVPYAGARASFIPLDSVVCVTPDDFGYWEVRDRLYSGIAGFHAMICNMDMLHRLIVRHLTGRPDTYGNTWGRRPPDLPDGAPWNPPAPLAAK